MLLIQTQLKNFESGYQSKWVLNNESKKQMLN